MEREIMLNRSSRRVFLSLACLIILFGLSMQAHAESKCVSLFSRIADQFNKVVPTYIDIRMEAGELLLGTVLEDADVEELTDKMKQAQIDAYKAIGEIVGDKNTPGAVNLVVPYHKYTGSSFVERTFTVSNNSFDRVKVKVKKTGGKNGAEIVVCKYTTDGNFIKTKNANIDKGKDTSGQERVIEFKGMKNDKYLTIHIINKGFASDKFDYKLTVTGEFDTEKLAEEESSRQVEVKASRPVLKETINYEALRRQ